MVSVTRYTLPAVVLLVVGVIVGIAAVGQAASMVQWEDSYRYTATQIDESEVPEDATVTSYQELSPTAQEIVLTVHDQENDYTTTERVSDLRYDDDDVAMDGYNYIQYEGEHYRVYAAIETGQGLGALMVLAGGLSTALGLIGVGLLCWAYPLVKLPSSLLSGLVVAGLGIQTAGMTPLTMSGGLAAIVLTWLGLTLLDRRSQVITEPRRK